MKTKIITIETHDNLISVRDKLSWAKTPRILLVWPKFEVVTLRYLDLKVLQRHSVSLGAQLGLVTRRQDVRREALELEIPVFESAGAAQRGSWPEHAPRRKIDERSKHPRLNDLRKLKERSIPIEGSWRALPAIRIVSFGMAVVAIVVLAAIFVPRAEISIYPQTQTQRIEIPLVAKPELKSLSLTGEIPARMLIVELSSEKTVEVNHTISTPESKSVGKARFTNLTQTEVEIPAGTVVRTLGDEPLRYQTMHATLIPAGLDEIVEVPLEALSPGSQANVGSGVIQGIEGSLSLSATVTNPEPTQGGTDIQAVGANLEDREALRKSLLEEMQENAIEALKKEVGAGDKLLEQTIGIRAVLQEEFDPPAGRAGSSLTLSMRVSYSGFYLLGDDLENLAVSALNITQSPGYSSTDQPVQFTTTNLQTDELGVFHLRLEASRNIVGDIDKLAIAESVRGRSVDEVRTLLAVGWGGRTPPEVDLVPGWWPWMPLIPFNVTVLIK